jgi:membrane protease YdiL (CAAX protease family)
MGSESVVRRGTIWTGVLFALAFPSIVTWIYFVELAAAPKAIQGATYSALKCVQFVFPAVWVCFVLGQAWTGSSSMLPQPSPAPALRDVPNGIANGNSADQLPRVPASPSRKRNGVGLGIVFGVAVTLSGWLVYRELLAESPLFIAAADKIRSKIAGFGLDSAAQYAGLAAFYALIHSGLEEYYWRWFVFGQLRRLVPVWAAILVSAVGFMAHHVIVLGAYFGGLSWITLLISSAVAIGGAFWAWLYERSNSLVGPWLSHAIVDAGIFALGYELIRGTLVAS